MAAPVVHQLPSGRLLALDDEGTGLRASWHLDRGFVNLSIWQHDRCVATFHLTIEDAGRLAGFLVDGLASATQTMLSLTADTSAKRSSRSLTALRDELGRRLRRWR